MKKRYILACASGLLVSVVLLASAGARPAQATAVTFPDVAPTSKAYPAIQSLAARGIVSGYSDGWFHPDDPVTRGQAMKMIATWRGLQAPGTTGPGTATTGTSADAVSDGAASHGAAFVNSIASATFDTTEAAYVQEAVSAGWLGGYPDGSVLPQAQLTREQMATVIVRALGLEGAAGKLSAYQVNGALGPFSDDGRVSPDTRPYLALALRKGLFTGNGNSLEPLDPVTRAEFSLVLARADSLAEDALAAVYTPAELALASFMDSALFAPHDSPVTGMMVLQNAAWYGIPPLTQLVIMAAETSLGDPDTGGALARHYNFGCLRYGGLQSPWGQLSDGCVWVAGKSWYSFPSAAVGMAALGRYLKAGADGYYLPILSTAGPDWGRFAAVYYGRGVPGFSGYVNRLYSIEARFRGMAAEHSVSF